MTPTPQWYDADTDDSDRYLAAERTREAQDECQHPVMRRASWPGLTGQAWICANDDDPACHFTVESDPVEAHDAQACRDIAAAATRERDRLTRERDEARSMHDHSTASAREFWQRAEAAEAKVARVEGLADELERDRDVCLAWIKDEAKHVDPDHPNRLSGMADLLNQHASKIRAVLAGGGDK